MSTKAPVIEGRNRAQILASLLKEIPGYVPGWLPADPSSSGALMQIFARYLEILAEGVNQVPERSLLSFLDMLGTHLLPAQAARAPLVFTLIDNAPVDVTLPEGSLVAVPSRPDLPSPLAPDRVQPPLTDLLFSTRQTVTLARAHLSVLYSINPSEDEFANHTADLTLGFTLFDGMSQTEHAIYLGHDGLFALGGEKMMVMLSFSLERFASQALQTSWEYRTEGGWSPLESAAQDDTTGGMRHDGVILLNRDFGPKAKQETYEGHTSYWLRGRLTTPLRPEGPGGERTIPVINDIHARVGYSRSNIAPEAAFTNGVPLDISKDFYPFGQQPATFTTFYLACKEVFQRKGARACLEVTMAQKGDPQSGFSLEWEYPNDSGWNPLPVQSAPGSPFSFNIDPDPKKDPPRLSFDCPADWAETSVNGTNNFWLRVRITAGDYGSTARANVNYIQERKIIDFTDRQKPKIESNQGYTGGEFIVLIKGKDRATGFVSGREDKDTLLLMDPIPGIVDFKGGTLIAPPMIPGNLHPPVVAKINLSFTYLTDPFELDHCLSVNDFVFKDHTEDCRWPRCTFTPFRPVGDLYPAVHFGFDQKLPSGLVSLYVDVQAQAQGTPPGSPFTWEYRSESDWKELGVRDETLGFRQSGMIQFIGPPDAFATPGLGGKLCRLRARLKPGEAISSLPVAGTWLNAALAEQGSTSAGEDLGSSDGNPGQTFNLQRKPVLENESIEVKEWRGRGEGWHTNLVGIPESDLRFESDPATGEVTAVWVTWHAQPHLYHSLPGDRHYTLERANGLVRFGDSRNGLVPPAGSRISATYNSGGGMAGNVPVGAITELRMAFPYVQSAANPVPASGGAEIETIPAVRQRGPHLLRHHERAVSAEDCEWLARQASPDVARVRCLPITGPAGSAQRGWITLIAAPFSPDPQPVPSPEFGRRLHDYLAERVPATVAGKVRIVAPQFTAVGVRAEIVPQVSGAAAELEARVRTRLNSLLHPLSGGPDGQGWAFGQAVYLSQVARVIEETPGVDYAREIRLVVGEQIYADAVPVDAYTLVAAGQHELKLTIGVD